MRDWNRFFQQAVMIGQLGLSLMMPLLLCVLFCGWLTVRFDVGGWVYIPGFFFGFGGSGMTAYKTYLHIVKQAAKEKEKKRGVSFNRHL